jgi:polyisoprenoid-binding protein YceI
MKLRIVGDLTLHGVTRPVSASVDVSARGTELTARAEMSINQTDFGIQPVAAGGGTVKVRDAVAITLRITARR